jgi:hypothetical protein
MSGRIIQGYFIDGRRPLPGPPAHPAMPQSSAAARAVPPPPPSARTFARTAAERVLPTPARPVTSVVQSSGRTGAESIEINALQLGIVNGGGKPLPQALLAKMETAFGADFSAVRVHVGPQPSRIGALAFAMGNDLYFSPGQFQPDSMKGQQLIGHELAHVIQQRQGRVRAPGAGIAVVMDRALEAEADQLGIRAAMARPVKPATVTRPVQAAVRRAPIQRAELPPEQIAKLVGLGAQISAGTYVGDGQGAFNALKAITYLEAKASGATAEQLGTVTGMTPQSAAGRMAHRPPVRLPAAAAATPMPMFFKSALEEKRLAEPAEKKKNEFKFGQHGFDLACMDSSDFQDGMESYLQYITVPKCALSPYDTYLLLERARKETWNPDILRRRRLKDSDALIEKIRELSAFGDSAATMAMLAQDIANVGTKRKKPAELRTLLLGTYIKQASPITHPDGTLGAFVEKAPTPQKEARRKQKWLRIADDLWSAEVNAQWMQLGIQGGHSFKIISPLGPEKTALIKGMVVGARNGHEFLVEIRRLYQGKGVKTLNPLWDDKDPNDSASHGPSTLAYEIASLLDYKNYVIDEAYLGRTGILKFSPKPK